MAGASSGGDANYWPGFVDALTNVVIAMVFVIVVLAMALSFSAQLLARRMAEKVAQLQASNAALAAQAASQAAAASAPLAPPPTSPASAPLATNRIDSRLPAPNAAITVKGDEASASSPGGTLRAADTTLVLDFAGTALKPDDEAQRRLVEGLVRVKEQLAAAPPGAKVLLLARGPDMAFTENQRTAYLRIMLIRNTLLEQGFAPERIATRIDTASAPGRASVSLVLEAPR